MTQQPAFLPSASSCDRAGRLEQLEGDGEEIETQDVALVGEQVVADAQPAHGREVAPDDAARDEAAHLGALADPGFEAVQRLATQLLALGILFVPLADLGVDIPTAVVERLADGGDLGDRQVLEVDEADHDVGHLHAGVVDVVLHLDRYALGAQPAHQQVAEHGVSQVADVGRLVGIDIGVLDDDLAGRALAGGRGRLKTGRGKQAGGETASGRRRDSGSPPPRPGARAPRPAGATPRRARRRCRGAFCFSDLARWSGVGKARSPRARRGGISATGSWSMPNWRAISALSEAAS